MYFCSFLRLLPRRNRLQRQEEGEVDEEGRVREEVRARWMNHQTSRSQLSL